MKTGLHAFAATFLLASSLALHAAPPPVVSSPGSPEALRVLRVVLAENDPTAKVRREKIEALKHEADPDWEKYQPLRWALSRQALNGSLDGWKKLEAHPIFGIRARFELDKLIL